MLCVLSGLFEGSCVQYASDSTMKIVFSCCQPSVVVSYDTVQGIHSVWALRKVTHDVSDHTYTDKYTHAHTQSLPVPNVLLPLTHFRSVQQSCGVQRSQSAHL